MEHGKNICPRCGGMTEEGFVQSRGMAFVKKQRYFGIREQDGDFMLNNSIMGAFFPAQYCEQCDSITMFSGRKGE